MKKNLTEIAFIPDRSSAPRYCYCKISVFPVNFKKIRNIFRRNLRGASIYKQVLRHTETPPEKSGGVSDCQKSFAEFFAKAKNKIRIILCRGVYLAQNTLQAASVEFVRHG